MDIYQEKILDHYHDPHNHGTLENPTHAHSADNPTCGDKISVEVIVKDAVVKNIMFTGEGCAISQAATSLVTDAIKNKDVKDALALTRDDVIALLGVEVGIGRIRCAMLGIETIQKALEYGKIEK